MMEAVEEPPIQSTEVESEKAVSTSNEKVELITEPKFDQKSNGDSVLIDAQVNIIPVTETQITQVELIVQQETNNIQNAEEDVNLKSDQVEEELLEQGACAEEVSDCQVEEILNDQVDEAHIEETIVHDNTSITINRVTFETEILVEANDNAAVDVPDNTNNILSELGESIELSEALRSSDVLDSADNNNALKQEVFNKEELLDILEGNDEDTGITSQQIADTPNDKILEAKLALQQLSRLKKTRNRKSPKLDKVLKKPPTLDKVLKKSPSIDNNLGGKKAIKSKTIIIEVPCKEKIDEKEENIVNVLVKDWEDEELTDSEQTSALLEKQQSNAEQDTKDLKVADQQPTSTDTQIRISLDSTKSDVSNISKDIDKGQPHRRLGRVIKKKVIFDPDNPDTFTKSNKLKNKVSPNQKDHIASKKIKIEQESQGPKSKSLISKLQWKKPSPRNSKQNKRLTEVDKLLMDEGAVNMIYQLTPEATKGKKNIKTKAEFIKKLQSSTPDSKEMKFRERKKEAKYEEGEVKKILGGKHSFSLSNSVKSPAVSEDFEAHSADDSIIYRRHSSSSYSSTCMSPRRLSDVDIGPATSQITQLHKQDKQNEEVSTDPLVRDSFMSNVTSTLANDTINKTDCLSIKEKLNSKLSLALKKRKRESTKSEKQIKQKRISKSEDKINITTGDYDFKYLSITIDKKLAEISVKSSESNRNNVEVIKELRNALDLINSREDVLVTLLTSECETLYSGLDLDPLLNENIEERHNYAFSLVECIRLVLSSVARHSKLVCTGVEGACSGLALALVALSDVALASETAHFALTSCDAPAVLLPGVSALLTQLSKPLVDELVIFGRKVSATDATRHGLVSRALWPAHLPAQLRAIARDLAAQPSHNLILKKKLLNLNKTEFLPTFLSYLEKERDLFVEYWTNELQNVDKSTFV